jgi:peptidyl-prolyl cis-trans isomerase C
MQQKIEYSGGLVMKRFAVSFFLIALLVSCSQKAGQQSQGSFVAKVGNDVITKAEFEQELNSLPDYAKQMFEGDAGREKFLDEVIKKDILYQEALKKGIDKDPDFKSKLEEFKKLTLASMLLEKEIMSKDKVSDQEVKDYYDKHKEEFTTTSQIRASHILVKTEAKANEVLARLKKGEKFEEIARKESLDAKSAANGGDIGYFSRGMLVPEFERAAASLKVGELSAPVKTPYGYHIIKVTDKKAGPVIEFDRVKDVIFQRLSGERQKAAFDNYISELRKNYKVEINKDTRAQIAPEAGKTEPGQAAPAKPSDAVPEKKAEQHKEEQKK